VNSDVDVQKALEAVALYQVDAEKGDGKTLAKEFGVRAYPTFVLANSEGKTLDRWLGYGKAEFLRTMAAANADLSTIEEKQARFASSPDARTAAALGRFSSATFKYEDAVDYFKQAQGMNTDPSAVFTYDIFDNMYYGLRDTLYTFDEVSRAADAALLAVSKNPEIVVAIAGRMYRSANKRQQTADVAKYLQAGLEATANSNEAEVKQERAELMVDFSLMVKHDTATAVEYKRVAMPEGWLGEADRLNEFAWWCFENNANLEEAEKLSRKSVELAQPGREKGNCLDTQAEIACARGNIREALDLSKKAAKEDPENKFFQEQVEKFEKLVQEKQGS
jgi:tetratricopeptide (TPR) repeat protein